MRRWKKILSASFSGVPIPAEGYEPGHSQPSFDKQFARDWLTSHPGNDWTLPEEIVQKTIDKYLQSYKMLTGKEL